MTRFMRRGLMVVKFGTAAPAGFATKTVTRSEITAATGLTASIADISGFSLENQAIAVPDMATTFESQIAGADQAADSSITFYEDDTTAVIETLLPKATTGYLYLLRKGDKPTSPSMDVFPVYVGSRAPEYSAGNDPARFSVMFRITSTPALDCIIPT